jgi:hypothetical protein
LASVFGRATNRDGKDVDGRGASTPLVVRRGQRLLIGNGHENNKPKGVEVLEVEDDDNKSVAETMLTDEQPGTPRKWCFCLVPIAYPELTHLYQSLLPRLMPLPSSPQVSHHHLHLARHHLHPQEHTSTIVLRVGLGPLRGRARHQFPPQRQCLPCLQLAIILLSSFIDHNPLTTHRHHHHRPRTNSCKPPSSS